MNRSTRYGLVGIGALAFLSLVHWARDGQSDHSRVYLYTLGVLPNLCAAIAIPFVFLSIWADQNPAALYSSSRRWFIGATLVTAAGLITWECIQKTSRKFVFDPHDIGATIVGLGLAVLIYVFITPKDSGRSAK